MDATWLLCMQILYMSTASLQYNDTYSGYNPCADVHAAM